MHASPRVLLLLAVAPAILMLAASGRGFRWQGGSVSGLATLAAVGQSILLATAWLLPSASEFDLIRDNISELALGSYGFFLAAAFVFSGVANLGLAFAIWKTTRGTRGSLIGSLLIAVYGVGAVLSAVFPTDRVDSPAGLETLSTTGTIHVAVALVSFLSIVTGMFVLTWALRRHARWRSSVVWLVLLSGSALALLFAQTQGPMAGLMQRLLVTMISSWLILVAIKIRSVEIYAGNGS